LYGNNNNVVGINQELNLSEDKKILSSDQLREDKMRISNNYAF
jgi:hypothetical protein